MGGMVQMEMQITMETMTLTTMVPNQDFSLRKMSTQLLKEENGQSLMEFIMTFAFVIMFVGVFARFALNITNGFIVHYVTYQSSRAFLVHDNNSLEIETTDNAAKAKALEVFESYLPDFPKSQIEVRVPQAGETAKNLFTGVVAKFEQPFALAAMGGDTPLKLVSESFLGRIPTIYYCIERACKAITTISGDGPSDCDGNTTIMDNGC